MKRTLAALALAGIFIFAACKKTETLDAPAGYRVGTISEVKQVESYSYLKLTENGKDIWIAITKDENAKAGMPVYFSKFTEMSNFKSPKLDMTFDKILFVEDAQFTKPGSGNAANNPAGNNGMGNTPRKPEIEKTEVSVDKVAGGVTLAELFKTPEKFEGKTIKVKAKVTKVNNEIMEKNWLHIQDGTEFNGTFDLTVTTKDLVNVNDVLTFEGKVSLNKDFGYGYSYKILLEDAKTSK